MGDAHGTSGTRGAVGRLAPVRVAAIASLTPLEELDADPFLVDSRSQHAMCARWAAERGYVVTRELLVRGLREVLAGLPADQSLVRSDEPGQVCCVQAQVVRRAPDRQPFGVSA